MLVQLAIIARDAQTAGRRNVPNLPFLVTGIEGEVAPILETNSQLSRLFAARETLEPFAWDNQEPQTQQNFARFVRYTFD